MHAFECEPTWLTHTFLLSFIAMWVFYLPVIGCLKDDQTSLHMHQLDNTKQEIAVVIHVVMVYYGSLEGMC